MPDKSTGTDPDDKEQQEAERNAAEPENIEINKRRSDGERKAEALADARKWLVKASLLFTLLFIVFCALAPALGVPGLGWNDSVRLLEITVPVFLGYLGTAAQFTFIGSKSTPHRNIDLDLLPWIVRGPLVVFGIGITVCVFAYGYSNRASAPLDSGLSIEALAGLVTACMGLLAAVTNVAVGYLFGGHAHGEVQAHDSNRK